MVFQSAWMPIVSNYTGIMITQMEYTFLNRVSSFEVMPEICLSCWIVIHSIWAKLQVVASVSASDKQNWNWGRVSAAMFAIL